MWARPIRQDVYGTEFEIDRLLWQTSCVVVEFRLDSRCYRLLYWNLKVFLRLELPGELRGLTPHAVHVYRRSFFSENRFVISIPVQNFKHFDIWPPSSFSLIPTLALTLTLILVYEMTYDLTGIFDQYGYGQLLISRIDLWWFVHRRNFNSGICLPISRTISNPSYRTEQNRTSFICLNKVTQFTTEGKFARAAFIKRRVKFHSQDVGTNRRTGGRNWWNAHRAWSRMLILSSSIRSEHKNYSNTENNDAMRSD